MIGTTEVLVIAAVVLVLFGSAAIPRFARALGRARKEFDQGMREGAEEAVPRPEPAQPVVAAARTRAAQPAEPARRAAPRRASKARPPARRRTGSGPARKGR